MRERVRERGRSLLCTFLLLRFSSLCAALPPHSLPLLSSPLSLPLVVMGWELHHVRWDEISSHPCTFYWPPPICGAFSIDADDYVGFFHTTSLRDDGFHPGDFCSFVFNFSGSFDLVFFVFLMFYFPCNEILSLPEKKKKKKPFEQSPNELLQYQLHFFLLLPI